MENGTRVMHNIEAIWNVQSINDDIACGQTVLNQFVDELQAPIGDQETKMSNVRSDVFQCHQKMCFFIFLCNV